MFSSTPGDAAGPVEAQWCEHVVRIGGVVALQGQVLAPRCAMPSHAQHDLSRDPLVLWTIVREANQGFGLYATVVEPGLVSAGDAVTFAPASAVAFTSTAVL